MIEEAVKLGCSTQSLIKKPSIQHNLKLINKHSSCNSLDSNAVGSFKCVFAAALGLQ